MIDEASFQHISNQIEGLDSTLVDLKSRNRYVLKQNQNTTNKYTKSLKKSESDNFDPVNLVLPEQIKSRYQKEEEILKYLNHYVHIRNLTCRAIFKNKVTLCQEFSDALIGGYTVYRTLLISIVACINFRLYLNKFFCENLYFSMLCVTISKWLNTPTSATCARQGLVSFRLHTGYFNLQNNS